MKVEVNDYGYNKELKKYFITYRVHDINQDWLSKLKSRIEDEYEVKEGELYLTVYFDENYFPFASDESNYRNQDFINREELEMTAYLLGILED